MTFQNNELQRRRRESRAFWNAFLQFWEHVGNRFYYDNFAPVLTGVDLTPRFLCDGCGQYVYDGGCGCGAEDDIVGYTPEQLAAELKPSPVQGNEPSSNLVPYLRGPGWSLEAYQAWVDEVCRGEE